MWGVPTTVLILLSMEIREYLLTKRIIITVEYLPGALNKEADFQALTVKDSSQLRLNPAVIHKICKVLGTPDIELFVSRVSRQVPNYFSWKLDPHINSNQKKILLDRNKKHATLGLDSFRKNILWKVFKRNLPLIGYARRGGTNSYKKIPSVSGIAAVLDDELIPLSVL